ncbi:hypothetical protein CLV33_10219 [Jejuia pallidilutea]|uniref:Uncharacterized protein n=1 Tax=Jejuia pallidilutea TaxID=504487 RepID=A0A362X1U6_9FLAO|nr:hypothetical protein CLV33_10219 [Jejuia pallidilutea]
MGIFRNSLNILTSMIKVFSFQWPITLTREALSKTKFS